jgi:tRNA pseudouridine38-40 synthase
MEVQSKLAENSQRWKCVCAYDGTDFAGWQKQPNGKAVQDSINQGLAEIFQHPVRTVGAGRTDAGVHAKGQVFHFEKNWVHGKDSLLKAMRAHFPKGISPRIVKEVSTRFHAHLSAQGKCYRYRTVRGWAMPQDERFVLSLKKLNLNIDQIKLAAKFLTGEHDFSAFAASRGKGEDENPVKNVWKIDVLSRGNSIDFVVEGGGFLYKMVRSMVGALLDVGVGKLSPDDLRVILQCGKRTEVVVSAPAHGLCLDKVFYRERF